MPAPSDLEASPGVGTSDRPSPGRSASAVEVRQARRSTPEWMRRYIATVVTIDLVASAAAAVVAFLVRFGDPASPYANYLIAGAVFPIFWFGLVHVCRGYAPQDLGSGTEEFRYLVRAGVASMASVGFVSYALALELARGYVVIVIPLTVLISLAGRYLARKQLHHRRQTGQCMKSVLGVGREGAVLDLVEQLRRDKYCGMQVIGACVPNPEAASALRAAGVKIMGSLDEAAMLVRQLDVDAVAVTSSSETGAVYLRKLSWDLERTGVELLVAPGLMEVAGPRMHMRPFVGLPLLYVEEPEFTGAGRLVKGAMDRFIAILGLLFLAPILAVIALAIRLDSPGPVIFRQTRIGKDGVPFTMLKFRTMTADAEALLAELADRNVNADGLLFKDPQDPRITRAGQLLRRYSLDELPQLVNVVSGTMSLVGPRPPLPTEVELYDESVRRRLLVHPGLTGLWQVSGRNDLTWEESVRLDLRYVENWSLVLDVMIMWKTVYTLVRPHGAY